MDVEKEILNHITFLFYLYEDLGCEIWIDKDFSVYIDLFDSENTFFECLLYKEKCLNLLKAEEASESLSNIIQKEFSNK